MGTGIHLSIIIPVYNSESFLNNSLSEIGKFLSSRNFTSELLVVDDGSSDRSLEIAKKWAGEQRPFPVSVIELGKNLGKGAGVAKGMLEAKGEYRIFLDSDLAYDLSQVIRILKALEEGGDLALACRVHPDSRYTISPKYFHYLYTRHLASRLINRFLRYTIIPHCSDSQAGLKGFRAAAAQKIFSQQIIRGFSFDIEALYLAEQLKFSIKEVGVEYQYIDEPTTVAFLQDGLGIVRDIVKIHLHKLKGGYSLSSGSEKKRLIINADDFGMTSEISHGILECVKAGAVKSFSVMVNSEEFDASMNELGTSGINADVGFHATLTWGTPLTDPQKIPTLVDKNGKFLSAPLLMLKSFLGKISEDEVYLELDAQCAKLSARAPVITHMDGHHHVHAYPVVCRAAEKVARKYGIKYVRAPREGLWSSWHKAIFRRLPMFFIPSASPEYWRARGFISSDNFGGYFLSGGLGLSARWDELLENLPYGLTEVMVHPGYRSENKDVYNAQREDEIKVLCNSELLDKAKKIGIEFTSPSEGCF